MSSHHNPKENHLLAALPEVSYACLLPDLELISMPLGGSAVDSRAANRVDSP
jgi:hypothetical protein